MQSQLSCATEPLRVLVADDDDVMRAFVVQTLQSDGCIAAEAHDGAELLELLERAFDEPSLRPDVVVVDVKMPRLSGLGILDALRRAQWSLPVVVITAFSDESFETVAKRLGAKAVLRKPFEPDDLLAAVRNAKVDGPVGHLVQGARPSKTSLPGGRGGRPWS